MAAVGEPLIVTFISLDPAVHFYCYYLYLLPRFGSVHFLMSQLCMGEEQLKIVVLFEIHQRYFPSTQSVRP